MDPAAMRQWVCDRRAAEARERASAADAWGPPEQVVAAALALVRLGGALHGWPAEDDPVTKREDLEAWSRFARLRRAFARQRG
jgi:hypothetical protein